jgi:hypothetical protein
VVPIALAAAFTVISGGMHLLDGARQYRNGPPPQNGS